MRSYDKHTVLVVDDRAEARAVIAEDLVGAGFKIVQAADGLQGWDRFRTCNPDLVITDLRMPRADGIELLRRIRSVSSIPVMLLSAYGDVPSAVTAIKGGAQEFLVFPSDLGKILNSAIRLVAASERRRSEDQVDRMLIGTSALMCQLRDRVRALSQLNVPVLISGDRGTGRDCVALALSSQSKPPAHSFLCIRADGSTKKSLYENSFVYLDGVDQLDRREQARWNALARASEGEGSRIKRLVASTDQDLNQLVRIGTFDPDLAELLSRFVVSLPLLRDRKEDLPKLARYFAKRAGLKVGRPRIQFERSALSLLREHEWLENVRQLEDVVSKLVAFSPRGRITRDRVQAEIYSLPESVSSARTRRNREQRDELILLLQKCGGNLAEVARQLDMSRSAVIYRAQKFGLLPKNR